jgi:phosphatidylglycerophosphatase A
MKVTTESRRPKPRLASVVATGLGLGYSPVAPGTFGSLLGAGLTIALLTEAARLPVDFLLANAGVALLVSLVGVWAADRVAIYRQKKDPQIVVVDEVAGQMITYLGLVAGSSPALGWKSLLAGFLLFRLFDISKPFPAGRAESLPGGLGIMADDWIAGTYAALLLALARHLGL